MGFYSVLAQILFTAARPLLNRKYGEGNDQRYGWYAQTPPQGALWVHAVSVGEVQSAYPFIKTVREKAPQLPIVLSTITLTGKAMARQLLGDAVCHIYYPWDAPTILKRAISALQPRAFVTVETEIWPEILRQLQKHGVPSFLINGRLSARSYEKYARFRSFWSRVIRRYSMILVRSEADRQRFVALGAEPDKVAVTGDCKVDALIERQKETDRTFVKKLTQDRHPLILAGSTHEGEEETVVTAFYEVLKHCPKAHLVLVPRHPERARGILQKIKAHTGLSASLLSDMTDPWKILLVDRIGMLFPLYSVADVAFSGGSLVDRGGQNVMEPASWGVPFCQGPCYGDFVQATEQLIQSGLCTIIRSERDMADFFIKRLALTPQANRQTGKQFFDSFGGASQKNWTVLEKILFKNTGPA